MRLGRGLGRSSSNLDRHAEHRRRRLVSGALREGGVGGLVGHQERLIRSDKIRKQPTSRRGTRRGRGRVGVMVRVEVRVRVRGLVRHQERLHGWGYG